MGEINAMTQDEYGLKASGILSALEKFSTLFGLKIGYDIFETAEVSKGLKAKDLTIQEANLASAFYRRTKDSRGL